MRINRGMRNVGFIALDGPLRRVECPKSQPRIHAAFHKPVVLFYNVIQVLALSELTILRERLFLLKALEGGWIGGVLVDGDYSRDERMCGLEHLTEEALSRLRIARGTQHEVQHGTRGINGAVEVIPALLDLDISLIHAV
jgi:hypothetical protein